MDEIDLVRYLQSLQQKLEESRRQLEESLRQWQEERQQQQRQDDRQRQEEDRRLEETRRYQQEQDDRQRQEEDRRLEETRRYQQERDLAQQRQRNLQHQQAEQFSLDKAAPQQAIAQREEGQVEVRKLSTSDFYTIETGQEIDRLRQQAEQEGFKGKTTRNADRWYQDLERLEQFAQSKESRGWQSDPSKRSLADRIAEVREQRQEIIQGIERHANRTPHELDRKAIEIHQSTQEKGAKAQTARERLEEIRAKYAIEPRQQELKWIPKTGQGVKLHKC